MRSKGVVLTSSQPFTFTGQEVDKDGRDRIVVHHGMVTSCSMPRPMWSFHAREVDVVAGQDATLHHAVFWLWRVPFFYFPWVAHPVENLGRKTGFLIPSFGTSTVKGTILGESAFWAINRSMDATLGGEYFSKRGWAQHALFEAKPTDTSYLTVRYFGVLDRGSPTAVSEPGPNGTTITLPAGLDEGGEDVGILAATPLGANARAVANVDYLSSYLFRLAWTESITGLLSEVRSIGFVSDNWQGYSFSAMSSRYQNFQSTNPGDLITIVHAPSFEASTPARQLGDSPVYWNFDAAAEGLSRREPGFVTSNVVPRLDVSPALSLPRLWHGWTLLPEVALRDTWYGDSLRSETTAAIGQPSPEPIDRRAFEGSLELRPPALDRVFHRTLFSRKLKHTVEPRLIYRYTTGVNNFASILRFDERDILSDTNEVEYGVINRLYMKKVSPCPAPQPAGATKPATPPAPASSSSAGGAAPATGKPAVKASECGASAREVASWELAQQYFLDPTFGGAVVAGRRNVFTSTEELTGIAFLTGPRKWSPIVSRLRVRAPLVDVEWQLDYDTVLGRLNASTAMATYHFPHAFSLSGGDSFLQTPGEIITATSATSTTTLLGPSTFNQFRLQGTYGTPSKRGLTFSALIGYDANLSSLQ